MWSPLNSTPHAHTAALFALAISLGLAACDDEQKTANETLAGVQLGGVSGGIGEAGDEPPLGAIMGGARVGGEAGGEPPLCEPCAEACPAIECDCELGFEAFEGCQEGCCLPSSEAVCEQLCATIPPPRECSFGQTRCLEGTPSAIQRCTPEGEWSIEPCGQDTECQYDACLPVSCEEGEVRCLDSAQRLSCVGGAWEVAEACGEGSVCADGTCTSPACASAVRERSYLGCEYLALELPNLVSRDPVEAPPVAVVLTNPSATESASVSLYEPEGGLAQLRSLVLLPIPNIVEGHPDYQQAQTVRSEVRDASGALVQEMVSRADQLLVPPGGIATLLLPHTSWDTEGSVVAPKAFRVVSDHPVGAYQFAPYCCNYSFSNDASLLIPTSALTGNYRFIGAPSFLTFDDLGFPRGYPATLSVTASKDNTEVRLSLPPQARFQPDTSGRLSVDRGSYVARLNKQETLLLRTVVDDISTVFDIRPQADFTGSWIEASEPVAVLSGHECTFYPQTLGACDHLEEQLFPVETWGQQFNLVPPPERGDSVFERVYWKFLGGAEGARITLSAPFNELEAAGAGEPGVPDCGRLLDPNDPSVIVLGEEGYCELSSKRPFAVVADQPITVMGIWSGQDSVQTNAGFGAHLGDPSIFLAAPARQYRSGYAFLTPNTYFSDSLTLTFNEGTQVILDGEELDLSGAQPLLGSPARFLHVPLSDGPHTLRASAPVGITVVAFDDFVSYAFTGGLNLSKR